MTLTSKINWAGREVGGVVLGNPNVLEDGTFEWDGSGAPNGEILADGSIVTAAVGDVVAIDLAPAEIPLTKPEKDAGAKQLRKATDADGEEGVTVAVDAKGKKVSLDEVHPERAARKQAKEDARLAEEAAAAEAKAAEQAAAKEARRLAREQKALAEAEAAGLAEAIAAEAEKAVQLAAFKAANPAPVEVVAEDTPPT